MFIRVFLAGFILISFTGCNSEPGEIKDPPVDYRDDFAHLELPEETFDYTPTLPANFTDSTHPRYVGHYDNMPDDNQTTDLGATLGRVIFYDKRLSANETISCASCHKQDKGFSDDAILSEGFQGGLTGRHSMGLANARYYQDGKFFWDERAETLEDQVMMPIQDPVEMGMDLTTLIGIMNATQEYPVLFTEAFGSAEITEDKISKALAQFVRSIISYQSKFDQGLEIGWDNFSDAEFSGLESFLSVCAQCHIGALQSSKFTSNNGIDIESIMELGVGGVTQVEADNGKFKIPSLRNVAVTAPYMHNGRFSTLEQVINHYLSGIQAHPNLDNRLKDNQGNPARFPLGSRQINNLIAFMNTLTDEAVLTDEKFSDPFK